MTSYLDYSTRIAYIERHKFKIATISPMSNKVIINKGIPLLASGDKFIETKELEEIKMTAEEMYGDEIDDEERIELEEGFLSDIKQMEQELMCSCLMYLDDFYLKHNLEEILICIYKCRGFQYQLIFYDAIANKLMYIIDITNFGNGVDVCQMAKNKLIVYDEMNEHKIVLVFKNGIFASEEYNSINYCAEDNYPNIFDLDENCKMSDLRYIKCVMNSQTGEFLIDGNQILEFDSRTTKAKWFIMERSPKEVIDMQIKCHELLRDYISIKDVNFIIASYI